MLLGYWDIVFCWMGELEKGDWFCIILLYGDFIYEIVKIKIVDKDDIFIIMF